MPSVDRSDGLWVDEMDGPERLERAKKRRSEQLKRWEVRESTSNYEPESKRSYKKSVNFVPNIVMLEAAARNDLDEVARLLESGVSPDLANEDGLTALHQSCIDGCDDMVKYLIEHRANVNACDNELWTPLHAAAACGHLSIIKYLLKNGGNIMALNLDGNLPMGVVEDNEEVEKFLDTEMLKLGYDEAAIEELRLNEGKELLNDLKDSVEKGRSLDLQDEDGATAFHVAAANGWTNVVDFLLENEADFEIADNDGWQPIHAAAAWGHDTILEILVASGADLDSKTNDSKTPLDLTEETEIIELIEELKTKEVKYPRKGKGVRRKRSNTSNSSIKRTSIHEKCELSHADTKAEGAALFMKLQNTESTKPSSPAEETNAPAPTLDGERQSTSSRDDNSSSGYVSEGGLSDTKTGENRELLKTSEITVKIEKKKAETEVEDEENKENKDKNNIKEETQNTTSTKIKQPPVPKPPRLGNSSSRPEPQTYINVEITPTDSSIKSSSNKSQADIKQDLSNAQRENIKPSKEIAVQNTELKTDTEENANNKNANKEESTNPLERRTSSTLPKLPPTDKRKAPEPPEVTTNTQHTPLSKKASKKDPASEVQKVPTKNAVSYSNSAAANTTASATTESKETWEVKQSKDEEKLLVSKSSGRGFALPRSRKTCCSVM